MRARYRGDMTSEDVDQAEVRLRELDVELRRAMHATLQGKYAMRQDTNRVVPRRDTFGPCRVTRSG